MVGRVEPLPCGISPTASGIRPRPPTSSRRHAGRAASTGARSGPSPRCPDFSGLRSIEDHQDLLETIVIETIAPENTLARNGTVNRMLQTGVKLIEVGDYARRLAAVEALLATQKRDPRDDPDDLG
jgi:hypothetical protein